MRWWAFARRSMRKIVNWCSTVRIPTLLSVKSGWPGIINSEPNFPSHFTSHAKEVLKLLLHKEPSCRLGTKGASEIKTSSFFILIDFEKLECKEVKPPFKPDVEDESDTKYVPRTYLQAKAEDSIDITVSLLGYSRIILFFVWQSKKHANEEFAGFTFIPDIQKPEMDWFR